MTHAIIIGSTRCGTTSLYNYLGAHSSVTKARGQGRREVHFFDYAHNYDKGIDWYWHQFKGSPVTLETSPTMLQHHLAPERLKEHVPDCQIIVCLRNPVDRAYSDYWLAHRKGWTTRTFEQDIKSEPRRLRWEVETPDFWEKHFYLSDHHLTAYLERGLYAKHLARWFEFFPQGNDQFMIIGDGVLFKHPETAVRTLWDWLGLEQVPLPKFRQWQHAEYAAMSKGTRLWLENYYKRPNEALGRMLGWTW